MWTEFMDMCSGGGVKEPPYEYIYIEAPEEEAKVIFYNRFGHNPERVTCTCCGDDYSISSHESLAQLTGYHRNCRSLETPRLPDGLYDNDNPVIKSSLYLEADEPVPEGYSLYVHSLSRGKYQTLEQYRANSYALFIHADEIKPEWRIGEVPAQGYVWVD